ncbi:sugar ABC transporter substrate-binding protein [Microbacterium esteraromaticum]|uniref:Sugar ABC transporter substrate-binding protein n=1 Tax=Microbacterium esteraromaticum TaxID=57043 RepID=A0A7D8AI19_9MICO|nr:sugar ABC transporter substrate-binding protein [Microbacterium esteraromaticum]QMU96505.1 sugar ABC transporter substrate-binding protein [Microbacterium esteraromaticum]
MKIRTILATGLAASVALALTACTGGGAPQGGGSADGEITGEITFQTWSLKNDKFTPYFEDVVAAFEKEHEGVKVNWIDQPAEGYEDKILQQAESGELPDVVNLPPEFAHELAGVGQLIDVKKESDIIDQYVEGGLEAYTFDGIEGTYAFPWYLGTELNYWNMALLEKGGITEAPKTVDEMLDAASALAKVGERTISGVPGPKTLQVLLTDQGAEYPFIVDGEFSFDTPEAVALVERYAELYKEGAVSPEALQNAGVANDNIDNFNKGTVAWTTAGPNYIDKNLAVNAPTLLPSVTVTSGFGNQPLFVQGISVSANSKNPAAALAFAEFVTDDENQIAFMKLAAGFFPGTVKANEDPSAFAEAAQNEQQKAATDFAAQQMATARVPGAPGSGYVDSMEGYAKQQIALAITGEISAKEALQKAQDYANENASE